MKFIFTENFSGDSKMPKLSHCANLLSLYFCKKSTYAFEFNDFGIFCFQISQPHQNIFVKTRKKPSRSSLRKFWILEFLKIVLWIGSELHDGFFIGKNCPFSVQLNFWMWKFRESVLTKKSCFCCTVWKIQNFYNTHILRKIKVGDI